MAVAALAEDWRSCDWLTEKERAMLEYSEKLTLTPYAMTKEDFDGLHDAGMDDEEILEAVIVCCTFNYLCRLMDALGGDPEGRRRSDHRPLSPKIHALSTIIHALRTSDRSKDVGGSGGSP